MAPKGWQYSRGNAAIRLLGWAIIAIACCLFAAGMVQAQPTQRTILALFDGDADVDSASTRIHRIAEMPLNHLGYRLVYHDIARGMPPSSAGGDFDHVLTWFDRPIAHDRAFVNWARDEIAQGTRFAILGEPGPGEAGASDGLSSEYLSLFGLRYDGFVPVTYNSRITDMDSEFIGYEHALDPVLNPFPLITPIGAGIETYLEIETEFLEDRRTSAIVTIGPNGGFVPIDYVLFEEASLQDPEQGRVKWVLNPFHFFEANYAQPIAPVPDVTTRAGRRIMMSHIDGDGWNNITEVDDPNQMTPRRAAQVILDEIIQPNPEIVFTVGLIGGDVDPDVVGDVQAQQMARALFALDNVEVAAHGYSHPYDWSYFEDYDPAHERMLLEASHIAEDTTPFEALSAWVVRVLKLDRYQQEQAHDVSTSAKLPRAYMGKPFSLDTEIGSAISVAQSLAPADKPVRLFQWTGDAEPYAEAIRAARLAGVFNLNGGENRYDALLPSIVYLSPILRVMGGEAQVYAPNTNEVFYTNDWTGPYFGQAMVAQTVARTGAPMRLKPYDLYFHMYSGEKLASLEVLKDLVELAKTDEFIAVPTSEYAAIAMSFPQVRITQTGPDRWRIDQRGALHTLRLDRPGTLLPDPMASVGYLGARKINGSLYVALDPDVPVAEVVLTDRPETGPALISSNWDVSNLRRRACGMTAMATGFGDGKMMWSALPNGPTPVSVERKGETLWRGMVNITDGLAALQIPVGAVRPVQLTVGCPEAEGRR